MEKGKRKEEEKGALIMIIITGREGKEGWGEKKIYRHGGARLSPYVAGGLCFMYPQTGRSEMPQIISLLPFIILDHLQRPMPPSTSSSQYVLYVHHAMLHLFCPRVC